MDAGKQAKIKQITETYEQEAAIANKTLQKAKQIKCEWLEIIEIFQKIALERTDELKRLSLNCYLIIQRSFKEDRLNEQLLQIRCTTNTEEEKRIIGK